MRQAEIDTKLTLVIPQKKGGVKSNEKWDKAKNIIGVVVTYIFLVLVAFFVIFPFFYMISASFMDIDTLNSGSLFPDFGSLIDNIVYNYSQIFSSSSFNYGKLVGNTLLVGITITCGSLIITILTAFAFARLNFRGRDFLFTIFLATMMIPGEMMIITNFTTMSNLGLISSTQTNFEAYLVLILPFFGNVFYIYLLRQTFKQIPNELYLAAKVDGKSDWEYLWKVMVPLSSQTIITILILNLIDAWNSYAWPSLVLINSDFNVLSVALRGETFLLYSHETYTVMYNWQMAATVMTTVPLLLLFIIFRKYIMRGVARAGIKG